MNNWKKKLTIAVLGITVLGGIIAQQTTQPSTHAQGNVQISGGPNPVFPPPPQ